MPSGLHEIEDRRVLTEHLTQEGRAWSPRRQQQNVNFAIGGGRVAGTETELAIPAIEQHHYRPLQHHQENHGGEVQTAAGHDGSGSQLVSGAWSTCGLCRRKDRSLTLFSVVLRVDRALSVPPPRGPFLFLSSVLRKQLLGPLHCPFVYKALFWDVARGSAGLTGSGLGGGRWSETEEGGGWSGPGWTWAREQGPGVAGGESEISPCVLV